jgi:hypothetical protein
MVGGDPLFRGMPELRVEDDGSLLYLKYTISEQWFGGGAASELWRVSPDGTKAKILDLPFSDECVQVDTYTLQLRHARVGTVSTKPNRAKKGESLYFSTLHTIDRFIYSQPVSCAAQPTQPLVYWQTMEKITNAVIAVETRK